MTTRSIKAIAVFGGSNYGAADEFADGRALIDKLRCHAGVDAPKWL